MKKTKTWVLVADGAVARVYQTDTGADGLVSPCREANERPGTGSDHPWHPVIHGRCWRQMFATW